MQDYVDKIKQGQDDLSYDLILQNLDQCIFFDKFQKNRCFSLYEILPSQVDDNLIKHKFKDEQDLQNYVLKTVFGRKRSFGDGTTLQDWLYLHPNKLATIREIRESITRLGNENPCLENF